MPRQKQIETCLKSVRKQLTLAKENERRHIAADLHDHIGQALVLTRLRLEATRKRLATSGEVDTEIKNISQSLLAVIQDIRHLIFELNSPILNKIGLGAAITEWVKKHLENKHRLRVSIIDYIQESQLHIEFRAILFRSIRELLTNVVKHANAKSVSVWMETIAGQFCITIRDDGAGFDPNAVLQNVNLKSGFGLFSIQERVANLGGKMKVISQPGAGCQILLNIPIITQNSTNER